MRVLVNTHGSLFYPGKELTIPEQYHGHCFLQVNGEHLPPVLLEMVERAWLWTFHPLRQVFPEIRITGTDDEDTYISVVNGQLVWPTPDELKMTPEQFECFVENLKRQ